MAVAFRSASSAAGNGVTSLTVSKPSGVIDTDIMVCAVFAYTNVTVTAPAGWNTLIAAFSTGDGGLKCYSFYKTASSEGSSYVFSMGSTNAALSMMAFSGALANTIRSTSTASANTGTVATSASLAGVQATDMVVLFSGGTPTASGAETIVGPTSPWTTPAATLANSGDWQVCSGGAYNTNGTTGSFTYNASWPNDMIAIACALELGTTIIVASDASATTVDTATAHGNAQDTGTLVDAATVVAQLPVADTATGVESTSVTVPVSVVDTGAGVDTATVNASLPSADIGSSVEQFTVLNVGTGGILAFGQDIGTGAANALTALQGSYGDAGSAAENATVAIQGTIPSGYQRIIRIPSEPSAANGV
jgi:hypothetical protein